MTTKEEEKANKKIYKQTIKNFENLIEQKIIEEPKEFLDFKKNIDNENYIYTQEKNLELLALLQKSLKNDNNNDYDDNDDFENLESYSFDDLE